MKEALGLPRILKLLHLEQFMVWWGRVGVKKISAHTKWQNGKKMKTEKNFSFVTSAKLCGEEELFKSQ